MNDPEKTCLYMPDGKELPAIDPAAALPSHIGRYRVEKVLGKGGFGLVYLAHDGQLQRLVAIKVPHRKLVDRSENAEAYLTEARTVASLDHPHIVPVFDVGGTDDFPCYVVSKYIDGTDLASRLKQSRLNLQEVVELAATVAEALHYAHKQGLVHRDIKPGNILLDKSGTPFVADFGLALREQDVGKGPRYAGTPAYMSPEQARGEGHRVDGRSDIFSLGAVFYELLVGRQPFRADSQVELLEQITSIEPRPPRQYEDHIPKELERICLKALSKRASERYSTAKDLADDLRQFLAESPSAGMSTVTSQRQNETKATTSVAIPTTSAASESQPIKIVPRGLRSFDAHDADFFLELLPGPRDREGLPDSLRFWKTRIEETDADNTFSVGLIYGPSGCGKSSLVKAGLLPHLTEDVIPVYIEATAEETETRLLSGLRKRCPALEDNLDLKETLAALRRGQVIPVGKKVLIVLDQFEQWLHAKKEEQNTELVQALRQCEGSKVQCIVMVRDDFWLSVSRFMRDLEIRLVEGQNSVLADLFDLDHARKVLAAFGRAFGKLPENAGDKSKDQKEFLNKVVSGLATEGKVICVRLALFAEMMKGKVWTPASLKAVGGTEGVGVTFLEETFSAATAPPEHRYHQKAARANLKALLPETGSDIKGHMRSYAELLEASGYGNRPKDFDDLIRILDNEIRLITPTDPEGNDANSDSVLQTKPGQKYYQLTHDYLVHSLREWLTRKQKETRRGKAELLLADRAAVWNARPENRQLPSLLQWLQICCLTAKTTWTPPQHRMMRRAGKYHVAWVMVVGVLLAVATMTGLEIRNQLEEKRKETHAAGLVRRLLDVETAQVPGVVAEMSAYRQWTDPLLRHENAQVGTNSRQLLHSSLGLLPSDFGQVEYLYRRLIQGPPQEFLVIRAALLDHKQDVTERLWKILDDSKNDQDQQFHAACALAAFAPDDPRWENVGGGVAEKLVFQKPLVIAQWADALKGVSHWLTPPLALFLVDEKRSVSERGLIASIYGIFAANQPDAYARLDQQLDEKSNPDAPVDDRIALARKQASIGVALLVMGEGEKVWPLLKHQPDPTRRSFLADRLAAGGIDPKLLTDWLDEEKEVSVRRAILLSLGEFGLDRLPQEQRLNLLPRLLQLYGADPDPGIHGAAEWLLRHWRATDAMMEADKALATGKVEGKRQWYLNRQGLAMMMVLKPQEFWMGERTVRHRQQIGRSFAIASKPVTVDQFIQFRKDYHSVNDFARTSDCPVNSVSWYDAAAYCNWLNEQEGIPKEQWCYLPNNEGNYADSVTMAPDYLHLTGYRLPTDAEWEYACRAGSETEYSFGEQEDLLGKHGWFWGNSYGQTHAVGSLKSNDLGMFDMSGGLWEWCQDAFFENVQGGDGTHTALSDEVSHVLRGGSFANQARDVRCASRISGAPKGRGYSRGFRPARTSTP